LLSLAELSRAANEMANRVTGHRVQEIVQPDAQRVVLTTYGPVTGGGSRRQHVLLSSHPETGRLSLLTQPPRKAPRPPGFAQYLRAHAQGARITGVSVLGGDRQVAFDLESEEGSARLLLSLFGRRSNLYYLDAEGCVVTTLRPLDATRPELSLGKAWQPPGASPPGAGADRFADVGEDELFPAIESAYGERESEGAHAELVRQIGQALKKEGRRIERKLEKLGAELAAAEAATELARHGELLKNALGSVKRGDSEAVVVDPESGEPVSISLDPMRSPAQNLDAIFKRYQKAVRKLTKGGAQEDAARDAQREHEARVEAFEAARSSEDALRALAEEEAWQALLRRHEPARPKGARGGSAQPPAEVKLGNQRVPRKFVPRRYRTAEDLEIWVGRSDAANDYLSTRLARGKDLFFHLDGAPGSHVILRTEGRRDPPSEALLDACELAVHFSKSKNATRADVHVVPIKNVRKPKGAKPGLVTVHGGKTLHLRRTRSRLDRILAARKDDTP
jgi:predicted ribosome quality control (RQC) complex YloA/Tae2 family protein